MTIKTCADLYNFVMRLLDNYVEQTKTGNELTLEGYLLALLNRIQPAKDHQPSYQELAEFLKDSFTGEPATFSEEWKDLPRLLHSEPNTKAYFHEVQTFEFTERHLKRLIADMHAQNQVPLKNRGRNDYYEAPSGRRYVNVTLYSFLERGIDLLGTGDYENEEGYEIGSWSIIDFILDMGQDNE